MANIYPNNNAALFGTWILANSNIRVTPARKIQIQTIITQAQTGGYVAQLYYSEFIAYTNQWYNQYLQYNAQQPAAPAPITYDALTTAWIAIVSSPSQQTIYSVDAFFKQLRADGNLLLDYFFLFAQDNQANARIDLMNPTLYAATEHNAPTWTANEGYTGNGSNMYLSINYTDSINGSNVTLNSETIGYYTRKIIASSTAQDNGAGTTTIFTQILSNYTGGLSEWYLSSGSGGSVTNNITQGTIAAQRTASNATAMYKNGVQIGTSTAGSRALVNKNDYCMADNNNGTPAYYGTNQYAAYFKGSGAINMVTFNSAVNLLMTNLGAHY